LRMIWVGFLEELPRWVNSSLHEFHKTQSGFHLNMYVI
jgi:hypothetical protein